MTVPLSIVWTQQRPSLWTGRLDGTPSGTIEHGERFTSIDGQGAEQHGFATLAAAQHGAQALHPEHV